MWRRRKDNLKRRMMSGILACLLVATSLTNTVGIITSFAGQTANIPRVSYKYDDLKNDKGQLDKMVQINVQAENESFAPGSEMVLKVYVQNLSDQNLTGGSLKWSGKGLEEAGFLDEEEEDLFNGPGWDGEDNDSDTSDLMEELGNFSVTGLRKSVALKVDDTAAKDETEAPEQNVEIITDVETEEEEDDTSDPQTDEEGKRIRGIELAPGEVYETRFYGTVEDMDSIVTRKVTFEFLAGTDDNTVAQDKAEFTYNTGMALVLPIEFDDGPALMTNELNTMYIHTRFEDEKILDEYTWDITDEDEATPSDAERHEITVATMSNGTEDSSEGTTPANMKYSIVTYGAKLEGVEAWYDDERSGWGEMTTGVSFRVKDDTEPGVYFGQVTTSIRREGKSYKTTQGFHFFVLGDGQLVLKGNINGAEIQVKGDRSSFPEGDMLSLKVTEVPAEKMDLVQEAMAQKAEELGVSVDKMKAMDIKVIADGVEQELEGEVEVTFSNLTLEKVGESTIIGAEEEENVQEDEVEEFEEVDSHAAFDLRKARAAAEDDQTDPTDEAETAETESESAEGGEIEKEESTLAVWHLDEEAGVMNEMDSEVNDDGDVVMATEHFSIYIVVDIAGLGGQITLTVQHYATITYPSGEEGLDGLDTPTSGPNGTRFDSEAKLKTIDEFRAIYLEDTMELDNQLKKKVDDLSKVILANSNRDIKNFTLKEIWFLKPGKKADSVEKDDWTIYTPNQEKTITLSGDTTIRMVYNPEAKAEALKQNVTFYDYNVTDGNIYDKYGKVKTSIRYNKDGKIIDANGTPILVGGNTKWYLRTDKQGINNDRYYKGGDETNRIGVGQQSAGIYHGYNNAELNGQLLNRGNLSLGKALPVHGMVSGIQDGSPVYNGIYDPGLFDDSLKAGKKIVEDYKLGFNQVGNTYTLSKVYRGDSPKLSDLEKLKDVYDNGSKQLFSNNFWPLDDLYYDGRDPALGDDARTYYGWNGKFPKNSNQINPDNALGGDGANFALVNKSDDLKPHNVLFGMRYDFEFVLGDYIGPLKYYFRGDDDFWLFVDGELKADLGGIHSSEGVLVDLDYLLQQDKAKVHKLTIFYMERGLYGSTCYMQFTLPDIKPIKFDTTVPKTEVTVYKKWDDHSNPYRPTSIQVQLYYKKDGTTVYEKYGGPVTLTTPSADDIRNNPNLSKDKWGYTWKELPADGYTYKVEELSVTASGSSYDVTYDEAGGVLTKQEDGTYVATITNVLEPAVNVEVVKVWQDKENQDGGRPDSVNMQLEYRKKNSSEKYQAFPGTAGILTLDGTVDWKGVFVGLPYYIEGEIVEYRVRELNDNDTVITGEKGNDTLDNGKWIYTVDYKDETLDINGIPTSGTVVGETTVTNTCVTQTVSRSVEKKWLDVPADIKAEALVGLFTKDGSEWKLVKVDNDGNEIDNPVTFSFPNGENKKSWSNLPEYANGIKVVYGIFEVDANGKPVTEQNSKITLNDYLYEMTSTDSGTVTTITNKLIKARLRVGKWVDNETVPDDVMKDEFIITVVGDDSKFETGVVLLPAGYGSTINGDTLDESKLSKYIEVLAKAGGTDYTVGEKTDLKEYSPSIPFITKYSGTGILNGNVITVMPGGDDVVLVHNTFDHKDYFHHDHSATNEFNGSGEKPLKVAQSQVVNLYAAIPERRTDDEPEKIDEDTRLT